MKKPPSQKELASVLGVTARHLRRWEKAEAAGGHNCSRPYRIVDLWRLFRHRYPKGWSRTDAERLALTSMFERFDAVLSSQVCEKPSDEQTVVALMLRCLAWEGTGPPAPALPRSLGDSLAASVKAQLRMILGCDRAREILVRGFFEASLIANAGAGSAEAVAEVPRLI